MVIKNIKIKNFKSYGNNLNEININPHKGELVLLQGLNGSGKCVKATTVITVDFEPCLLGMESLQYLLEVMGEEKERMILGYIKEKYPEHEVFQTGNYSV